MSPWRLEMLRVWRTRRLVALAGAFVLMGLGDPALTRYLPELVKGTANGITVIVPTPTPAAALASFAHTTAQLGTLVIVVVAAASLAIDARPALAAFYRTRTRRPAMLILPRYVAVAVAGTVTLALGLLGAWYETAVLIGPLRPAALAAGFGLEALWVCFSVAVVAVWASIAKSVLAIVGASIASLLALALVNSIGAGSPWSPAALASSVADLVGAHHPGVPWHAVAVTAIGTVLLIAAAIWRLPRRGP